MTDNKARGKLPRHWAAVVFLCECICMWLHSENICFHWKSTNIWGPVLVLPTPAFPGEAADRSTMDMKEVRGDIKSQRHDGLAPCHGANVSRPHHWFPVRQMTFWQGNSVNVWMVGWPRICKLCRRLSFLLWCSAWRPRLGMIQLGTSQDSNPNAYFNKVSVFVHGWLHIRRGQHLRAQHSIGHVCETRTAFHVAVCLNRITHCNMKARWEFQSLIDNTLSFYSFWFLIQHKLETVTIWHTYQLMTERKQSMDILMQKS